MIQKVSLPVSVVLSFDHKTRSVCPRIILWEGRRFTVDRLGYHHTYRQGKTLFHVFSVAASGNFFRLVLDTANLFWRLEEVSDGLPS